MKAPTSIWDYELTTSNQETLSQCSPAGGWSHWSNHMVEIESAFVSPMDLDKVDFEAAPKPRHLAVFMKLEMNEVAHYRRVLVAFLQHFRTIDQVCESGMFW